MCFEGLREEVVEVLRLFVWKEGRLRDSAVFEAVEAGHCER